MVFSFQCFILFCSSFSLANEYTSKPADEKGASQAENSAIKDERLAEIDTKHQAETLIEKLKNLSDDASPQERNDWVRQVYKAKLYANVMYRRANMATVPFPEVAFPE